MIKLKGLYYKLNRAITLQLFFVLCVSCSEYDYSIYDPSSPNYIDAKTSPATAVDLGLSVYWASYNVGSVSPEDYGHYYAWGRLRQSQSFIKRIISLMVRENIIYIMILVAHHTMWLM